MIITTLMMMRLHRHWRMQRLRYKGDWDMVSGLRHYLRLKSIPRLQPTVWEHVARLIGVEVFDIHRANGGIAIPSKSRVVVESSPDVQQLVHLFLQREVRKKECDALVRRLCGVHPGRSSSGQRQYHMHRSQQHDPPTRSSDRSSDSSMDT